MRIRNIGVLGLSLLGAACGGSSGNGGNPPPNPPGPVVGLDARPVNTSCAAPERFAQADTVALERVFAGLPMNQPLGLQQAPGDDSRWYLLEKGGRVRVFANDPAVTQFDLDFIDLTTISSVNTASEGGLLGMAFHPDYVSNRAVYLSWTEGVPMVSVVARFTSADGGATLDPGSRLDILRVNQDFNNHNGGHIAFGPDGFLYIGFGDGGSGGDPNSRAQDTRNLLGAMLRIDVDAGTPYAVPAGASGNPFSGNALCPADHSSATSCPEIYAWGLRNPWRWSFDRATGALWLGDVGQNAFEEIDRIERGGNYGWDCREGLSAFASPAASCATANGLLEPVHVYGRSDGVSVTGGYVYRGSAIPALVGHYVFADFGTGRIWRLDESAGTYAAVELLAPGYSIASFAEDTDGELYVVDIAGAVYALVPGPGTGGGDGVASLLSDTGCFDALDPTRPVASMIPYDVAAPFWADGAEKERWLAIPNGTTIAVDAEGDLNFPPGAVLAKHFRLNGELIETRLMMRHPDGAWAGYTYEWNAAGTDAARVVGGRTVAKSGQDWIYPSEGECLSCHTAAAGFALGPEVGQLNHALTYAASGRTANQLATLDAIGMFSSPLGDPAALPAQSDPDDASASLTERARSYLHTNCAQCHRPGGPTPVDLDLRAATPIGSTNACSIQPVTGDVGIANPLIVAPGEPDRSVLLARASSRDASAMPPLGSGIVDSAGTALLREWIAAMNAACQ